MTTNAAQVERWGMFEITLEDSSKYEKTFTDVSLEAEFCLAGQCEKLKGFYDGEGVWRIRCMPREIGECRFRTFSNAPALDGKIGGFEAVWPSPENRGPVTVKEPHFYFADESSAFICGSTGFARWRTGSYG